MIKEMAVIKKSELQEVGIINDDDYLDIVTKDKANRKIKFQLLNQQLIVVQILMLMLSQKMELYLD